MKRPTKNTIPKYRLGKKSLFVWLWKSQHAYLTSKARREHRTKQGIVELLLEEDEKQYMRKVRWVEE